MNLEVFSRRYEELTQKLADPSVSSNPAQYAALMKEFREITPIVETYTQYRKAVQEREEAKELMNAPGMERELRELAAEEYEQAGETADRLSEELKILLLPKDPNDSKNVIVEIRGGAGGEEAALFSAVLFRMYSMYAQQKGWSTELLNVNETELGGYKEISFTIAGDGAYSRLKYESGVHRVQRVPQTESQGRIQTSTATVAVLPEVQEVEIHIDPADIKMETYRSSGAGGQHINKTDSAVRLIHLPTGMVAECQEERSQFKNRDKAMKLLRARLYDRKKKEQEQQIRDTRKTQVGTADRSERIRTYNYPQGRITDHRIGLTLYSLDRFINGDMDEMMQALRTNEAQQRLKHAQETEE